MNRIDELIKEKCPNGVEYKNLESLVSITTGRLNANSMEADGEYLFFTCDSKPFRINTYAFDGEAITISGNGSQVGHLNYYIGKFNAYQRTYVLMDFVEIIGKFLYHYLAAYLKKYILDNSKKGSVPYITLPMLTNFKVPVPPIELQEEIVRILDKFGELETELETELEVRKSQYEFWRGKLLNSGFEKVKLQDIADYSKDRISFKELNEDNYVGVDNLLQNKMGKAKSSHVPVSGNSTKFDKDDILIGNIRPYLRKIWIADCYGGTNGDVLDIRVKDKGRIYPRFLYYVLSSEDFFEYNNSNSKGAKMPRGDKQAIMNYGMAIPPLEEQERIVSILDKFDKLVNDITVGLPAEIEARRKQYEYYRNKLLNFEVLKNE